MFTPRENIFFVISVSIDESAHSQANLLQPKTPSQSHRFVGQSFLVVFSSNVTAEICETTAFSSNNRFFF